VLCALFIRARLKKSTLNWSSTMKLFNRFALVVAMVGVLLSSVVGVAGAQTEPPAYLGAVNGVSTDDVAVAADGTVIADALPYAETATIMIDAGTYNVSFVGGTVDSAAIVDVATGSAQTVVSGYGEAPDTAKAYPIDLTPIEDGMAKVTVWNATTAPVNITVDGDTFVAVRPGDGLATKVVPAGTTVAVEIDGLSQDVATTPDSYTDVFAVNDTQTPAIALAVVPSMTDLIAQLAPPAGEVAVPDVVGQAEADAEATITGAGLVPAKTEAADDTVPVGSVISQDPAAGTMVASGSTVNIAVSTGPDAPATVPVPDVTGQPAADAQATLEAEGFTVAVTEQPSMDVEEGLVIETNPAAGAEVAPGTEVTIVVSTGAEDVIVPDFTGMSQEDATKAAEDVGLTIAFVEDPDNPDSEGVVVSQEPAAGSTAAAGTEVVAQLSPDLGEPWSIVTLDPDRLLTVTGVGLLPGSTVRLSVVGTDKTASVAVQDNGSWISTFDLSEVDNDTEFVLVEGTAADTSEYSATFKIPAAGESTDQPTDEAPATEESSGFPLWGWAVIGLAIIAIGLLVIRMVGGGSDGDAGASASDDSSTDTGSSGEASGSDTRDES
jgi:beta-lactam-binding protein with PASTA domain